MNKPLLAIGVMTGNSLDGADVVLTAFSANGKVQDLCSHFLPFSESIYRPIRALQSAVASAHGDMQPVVEVFSWQSSTTTLNFDDVQDRYIASVAQAINELIAKAKQTPELSKEYNLNAIDVIGLHGQTCDHCPPSRVNGFSPNRVYTVQIGNGQRLADLTGITVVYDFRSDDIMHGGEGAPLAPIHNQHLSEHVKSQGYFPITFCNAGNTGNLAHITHELDHPGIGKTLGWDSGPFNHYPDLLMRQEYEDQAYDIDGKIGQTGIINLQLLRSLFQHAVKMENGDNYLLHPPPKSGDPNYYKLIPELTNTRLPFQDRLRTVEYFSAYIYVHSLSLTPPNLVLPVNFAIFGGGWLNPVALNHFKGLLNGDVFKNPILPEHEEAFKQVRERLEQSGGDIRVDWSNAFGFDGKVMEARIFADMARCRLIGKPFSTPDTTGALQPVVGGIIRYPNANMNNATESVRTLLQKYGTKNSTLDNPDLFDARWSRASAGWSSLAEQL